MKLFYTTVACACLYLQSTAAQANKQNGMHLRGAQTNIREIDIRNEKYDQRLLLKTQKSKKGKKGGRHSLDGFLSSADFEGEEAATEARTASVESKQEEGEAQGNVETVSNDNFMGSPSFQPTETQNIEMPDMQNSTTIPANPDDFEDRYKSCVQGLFHVLISNQETQLDYYLNLHNGHCTVINKRCPSFYRTDLVTYSTCADECLLPDAVNPCE